MKKVTASFLTTFIFVTVTFTLTESAASQILKETAGAEIHAYPAGLILGVRGEIGISYSDALVLRMGYNVARRGDFGEHDDERGGGPGFGIGYHRHLDAFFPGLVAGLKSDLWFMDIDWQDEGPLREGTTEIVVLQPAAEVGYDLFRGRSGWQLFPSVSFGYEINVNTDGEPVGEGAILMGGLTATFRL